MVSVIVPLTFLPVASVFSNECFRVSTSLPFSITVDSIGTTLPAPHMMLPFNWPFASSIPSQPALPPGIVNSQSPRNGLSAAAALANTQNEIQDMNKLRESRRIDMRVLMLSVNGKGKTIQG